MLAALLLALTFRLHAQDTDAAKSDQEAELAKKLQNPVAALISVPIQNNWDFASARLAR